MGNNKELFRGDALRMAGGWVRVEDVENHLCEGENGGVDRLIGRWQGILISVEGLRACLFIWERMDPLDPLDPQCIRPIMEGHICESMDPQSTFGNFAIMGPLFVWLVLCHQCHGSCRGHMT